jgi:hypothetical protein
LFLAGIRTAPQGSVDARVPQVTVISHLVGRDTRHGPSKPESTGRVRLLGSDDFPLDAKREAAHDLTPAACSIAISDPLPLDRIAETHDRVDAGARQRVPIEIPG